MPQDPFYKSQAWQALRLRALKRDRWQCVICGASLKGKGAARVDHIQTRKAFPHLALNLANVRSLCPGCDAKRHAEKGGAANTPVDINGYPEAWRDA